MHLVDGGSLVIQDARQTDAGRYQCIARNAAGTRESVVATLRIHSEYPQAQNYNDGLKFNSIHNCKTNLVSN